MADDWIDGTFVTNYEAWGETDSGAFAPQATVAHFSFDAAEETVRGQIHLFRGGTAAARLLHFYGVFKIEQNPDWNIHDGHVYLVLHDAEHHWLVTQWLYVVRHVHQPDRIHFMLYGSRPAAKGVEPLPGILGPRDKPFFGPPNAVVQGVMERVWP